jgi:hypothetical protein
VVIPFSPSRPPCLPAQPAVVAPASRDQVGLLDRRPDRTVVRCTRPVRRLTFMYAGRCHQRRCVRRCERVAGADRRSGLPARRGELAVPRPSRAGSVRLHGRPLPPPVPLTRTGRWAARLGARFAAEARLDGARRVLPAPGPSSRSAASIPRAAALRWAPGKACTPPPCLPIWPTWSGRTGSELVRPVCTRPYATATTTRARAHHPADRADRDPHRRDRGRGDARPELRSHDVARQLVH